MTRLIFQYHRGPEQPWVPLSQEFAKAYAARVDADYLILDDIPPFHPHHFYGALLPFLPPRGYTLPYDAVLYLDTDVICLPTARDIFQEEGIHQVAAVHLLDGPCSPESRQGVEDHLRVMNPDLIDHGGHANAGVVYYPPGTPAKYAEWLRSHFRELCEWAATPQEELGGHHPYGSYDQCIMNSYGVATGGLHRLDPHYNYHLTQFQPDLRRARAGFIHYHGANKHLLTEDLDWIRSLIPAA